MVQEKQWFESLDEDESEAVNSIVANHGIETLRQSLKYFSRGVSLMERNGGQSKEFISAMQKQYPDFSIDESVGLISLARKLYIQNQFIHSDKSGGIH